MKVTCFLKHQEKTIQIRHCTEEVLYCHECEKFIWVKWNRRTERYEEIFLDHKSLPELLVTEKSNSIHSHLEKIRSFVTDLENENMEFKLNHGN